MEASGLISPANPGVPPAFCALLEGLAMLVGHCPELVRWWEVLPSPLLAFSFFLHQRSHHQDLSAAAPRSPSDTLVLVVHAGGVPLGVGSRDQGAPKGVTKAWGLAELPAKERGTCPGAPGGTGQAHLIGFGCKLLVGHCSYCCSWPCNVKLASPHPFFS